MALSMFVLTIRPAAPNSSTVGKSDNFCKLNDLKNHQL